MAIKKQRFVLSGLASVLGLLAYVSLVAFIMPRAGQLFGNDTKLMGTAAFLLIFVFSALVSSSIVLGYPVWLYFEGRKRESLYAFVSVVAWLFLLIVVLFIFKLALG